VAYTVFKEFEFAAAHHIPDHPGKCRHLHGHNYRIRVFMTADRLDSIGMVIDFAHIKAMMQEVVGHFDHRVINDFPPFDVLHPTAEQLSEYVFRGIEERVDSEELSSRQVRVARVEVWENATSCAIYEP
jgi:6-pyruvoyltetrahydropterin/6-carboxytetrahydropterin synthase